MNAKQQRTFFSCERVLQINLTTITRNAFARSGRKKWGRKMGLSGRFANTKRWRDETRVLALEVVEGEGRVVLRLPGVGQRRQDRGPEGRPVLAATTTLGASDGC
jgi:hypothetical protein